LECRSVCFRPSFEVAGTDPPVHAPAAAARSALRRKEVFKGWPKVWRERDYSKFMRGVRHDSKIAKVFDVPVVRQFEF